MAVTTRKRWLVIAGSIISLLSSWLTSYIERQDHIKPVSNLVEALNG